MGDVVIDELNVIDMASSGVAGDEPTADLPATGDTVADDTVADDTASRLVRAAIEVFTEKGYDGAGVAEIARRAGLTTGAIYSRFTGKAQLLSAAIGASGLGELDRLFAQQDYRGRATDLLATVGSHLLDPGRTSNRALLLEAFTAARRDPEVADVLRRHLALRADQLGQLIDDSKADGLIDADLDTAAVVHFIHAVGLGFVLFSAVGAEQPNPQAWEHLLGHLIESVVNPASNVAVAAATSPGIPGTAHQSSVPDGIADPADPADPASTDPGNPAVTRTDTDTDTDTDQRQGARP
jgi:AcrR family transcriptional regulator